MGVNLSVRTVSALAPSADGRPQIHVPRTVWRHGHPSCAGASGPRRPPVRSLPAPTRTEVTHAGDWAST